MNKIFKRNTLQVIHSPRIVKWWGRKAEELLAFEAIRRAEKAFEGDRVL